MKQMNRLAIFIVLLMSSVITTGSVYAEPIEKTIPFQGFLTTSDGVPVMDDTYTLSFSLWDGPNDLTATKLWEESVALSVTKGIYRVNLGETNPFPYTLNFGDQYYIGVQVENNEIINGSLIPTANTWHAFRADTVGGRNLKSISQSSTLEKSDDIVCASGDITVTLPPAADVPKKWYTIKKMDDKTTTLTINTSDGGLINDTNSMTITKQFLDQSLISNGLQWYSLGISDISGITTTQLLDNAITSAKIDDGTITGSDLQNLTIETTQLADHAVTSAKISNGTITGSDIQDSAISYTQLADGAVTAPKLANNPGNGTSGQGLISNGDGSFDWDDVGGAFRTTEGVPDTHNVESGNVGIGTTTPTEKLEVDGNIKITNDLILANGSSSVSQTILTGMMQTEARSITLPDASGIVVVTDNGSITVPDGSITASKLANNPGNGTSGQILISNGDGSFDWGNVDETFTSTENPTTHTVETGNVGIGTSTPTEKLEVDGNVKLTNDLILANGTGSLSQTILTSMTQSEARTISLPDNSGIVVVTDDGNISIPDASITASKLANNPGNGTTGQVLYSNEDGTFYWGDVVGAFTTTERSESANFDNSIGNGSGSGIGQFSEPADIAFDSNDNIYVADYDNSRIQVFTSSGEYSYSIGTGNNDSGENDINRPSSIAIDSNDNIYVTEFWGHRVHIFTAQGNNIGSFGSAGLENGQISLPSGIAVDNDGNIYVAEVGNDRIQIFLAEGNFNYSYSSTIEGFNDPYNIAFDNSGNLYVADEKNHCIKVYNNQNNLINTIGSSGSAPGLFNNPRGVYVDSDGLIFVADANNERIQVFTASGEYSYSICDGVGSPRGVTVHKNKIYVVNNTDQLIVFDKPGITTHTVETGNVGIGATTPTEKLEVDGNVKINNDLILTNSSSAYQTILKTMTQSEARTITLPDASGVVLVTDDGTAAVPDGSITSPKLANNPGNGNSGDALFSSGDGSFYWGDAGGAFTTQVGDSASLDYSFGGTGSGAGQLNRPNDIAFDSNNNIYVVEGDNHRIQVFNASGEYSYSIGCNGGGQKEFRTPAGIAIDSNDNIYVAEIYNHRIQVLNASGEFSYTINGSDTGSGLFQRPMGVEVDSNGKIYVADTENDRIQVFTADGNFSYSFGTSGDGPGQFNTPAKVALDNSGNIYVAEASNNRIQVFTAQGNYAYSIGTSGADPGQLNQPQDVDVDNSGNIYVADAGNSRIQVFTASGAYAYSIQINLSGNMVTSVNVYNDKIYVTEYINNFILIYDKPESTHSIDTGNVGIGTTTPTEKLEVDGNIKITNDLILANATNSVSQTILKAMTPSEARTITLPDASGIVVVSDDGSITIPDGSITAPKLANNPGNGPSGQTLISKGDGTFEWGGFVTTPESVSASFDYSFGNGQGSEIGQFNSIRDIAFDSNDNIYVADYSNHRIQVFTSSGEYSYSLGTGNSGFGQNDINSPMSIEIDSNDNIYVLEGNHIHIFTAEGDNSYSFGGIGSGEGEFGQVSGIAMDNDGSIYVADSGMAKYCIHIFLNQGNFNYSYSSKVNDEGTPSDVEIDNSGNIYVLDEQKNRINIYDDQKNMIDSITNAGVIPGTGPGELNFPRGIDVDSDGLIYVAELMNHRIQVFTASGDYSYSISEGLSFPNSVKVHKNKIYIGDGSNCIMIFDKPGKPATHIVESGNVGIGTTSPSDTIEVSGTVKINDVLKLEPMSIKPANVTEGMMFYNGNDHILKVYDGSGWRDCF